MSFWKISLVGGRRWVKWSILRFVADGKKSLKANFDMKKLLRELFE